MTDNIPTSILSDACLADRLKASEAALTVQIAINHKLHDQMKIIQKEKETYALLNSQLKARIEQMESTRMRNHNHADT
jgi:hypothetical protein